MSRDYASVYLTIWNDPDFRGLPADAQWLYFAMLTHPSLSSCGVMEWREARLIKLTADMTVERLRHAAWELGERRLVAVDPDTEEALVRSFVRHDGVLKSPNITKKMVREHATIGSLKLMFLVSREVRRGVEEHPEYRGAGAAEPVAKQFPEGFGNPFDWVPIWFQKGSREVTPKIGEGFHLGSPTLTPTLTHTSSDVWVDAPAKPKRTRKAQEATQIPDDWHPTQEHIERAHAYGLDIDDEAENFRLNAETNGRWSSAWNSAFTTWLKKSREFKEKAQTTGYRTQDQIMRDMQAKAAARTASMGSALNLIEGGRQ